MLHSLIANIVILYLKHTFAIIYFNLEYSYCFRGFLRISVIFINIYSEMRSEIQNKEVSAPNRIN